MRTRLARGLCAVLCSALLVLTAALVAVPRQAQAKENYRYTVRVFGGNEGLVNGEDVYTVSGDFSYGDECRLDTSWVTHKDGSAFSADDGSKYYVKGFRVSGQDNRDSESRQVLSQMVFTVTEDVDLIVAYGAKGNMVSYTVNFVEYATGEPVKDDQGRSSVTYIGKEGDKVVVPYEYVPGYRPRYRNITGTLGPEGSNIWTLEYISLDANVGAGTAAAPVAPSENPEEGTTETTEPGETTTEGTATGEATTGAQTTTPETPATPATPTTEGEATAGADTGAAADAGDNAGADAGTVTADGTTDAGDGEPLTPVAPETEEILDVDNPLASPGTPGDDSGKEGGSKPAANTTSALPLSSGTLAIIALIVLIIALLLFFLIRRRKKDDDEEDLDQYA